MKSLILLLLLIEACSSKHRHSVLYGNWAVLSVTLNGVEISGIEHGAPVWASQSMIIDRQLGVIQLPIQDSSALLGRYRIENILNEEALVIYGSNDERFNDTLFIKTLEEHRPGPGVVEYWLQLCSDKLCIYAKKSVLWSD